MAVLDVKVVAPDQTVFDGEASSVVAPAWDGNVGILPGHAPMIALLGHGQLAVDEPGGGSFTVQLAGGVLKVEDDRVSVLTEYAGAEAPEALPPEAVLHPEDASRG